MASVLAVGPCQDSPKQMPAPALPFYDWGACPAVTGITGAVVTFRPGLIRMDRDLPEQNLRRGDTILTYAYRGEGFSAVWF